MLSGLTLGMGILSSVLGGGSAAKEKDKASLDVDGFKFAMLEAKKPEDTDSVYSTMDAGAKEALEALREMSSGGIEGYWKWMIKELREDVMEEMNVSEEELAAMPVEQRSAVEEAINDEVEKRLKEAMGVQDGQDAALGLNAEEMIEKVKQAMQTAQGAGYKEDKKGILEIM